ncbi:MAG: c-type cytochrome [Verrucomicrobiales bacterium]
MTLSPNVPTCIFRRISTSVALLALIARVQAVPADGEPDNKSSRESASVQLPAASGVKVGLFADGRHLKNVSALSIADDGRLFAVETYRRGNGITDNRENSQWLVEDAASRSVADRLAMYARHADRHPPSYFTGVSEKIQLVEDRNGDGKADFAVPFEDKAFGNAADGIASGILAWDDNIWFACIPKVWRFTDRNRDGKPDQSEAVHDGFGLHVSFFGHDLNGFTPGPDGRLYFTIADRGANILNHEGEHLFLHGRGAVMRMEMDGSHLEIHHSGLRNPKELAFDDFGNLFNVDNNGDAGDLARVTEIVEGADSGWRMGHQMLISFSKKLGHASQPPVRWMEEKMWEPANDDQPWWIFPPIANFTSGPAGMTRETGSTRLTGSLPPGAFIICDYRGSPQKSGVRWFTLQPQGDTFRFDQSGDLLGDVACTDAEFGPDGKLYVSDYIGGWGVPNDGRVWTVAGSGNAESEATSKLIREGMTKKSDAELTTLLGHADQRVRLRAQFALARRNGGEHLFVQVARDGGLPVVTRLHGLWGIGQVARLHGSAPAIAAARDLLLDSQPDIRAWAAVILAESGDTTLIPAIARLLGDENPRVAHRAAGALARLRPGDDPLVVEAVERFLKKNDPGPRATLAGARLLAEALGADGRSKMESIPTALAARASVVAARRLRDPGMARFLDSPEQAVALEALAAIHDEAIECPEAPAALLKVDAFGGPWKDVPVMALRRLINLNYRAGGMEDAGRLWQAAANPSLPIAARLEALFLLENWGQPHAIDRVTGDHHPLPARPAVVLDPIVQAGTASLIEDPNPDIQAAVLRLALTHGAELPVEKLQALATDHKKGTSARVQAIRQLASNAPPGTRAFFQGLCADKDPRVAASALINLGDLEPDLAFAEARKVLSNPSAPLYLRQEMVRWLGVCGHPEAAGLLGEFAVAANAGNLDPGLGADLHDAITTLPSGQVTAEMSHVLEKSKGGFAWAANGGDVASGHSLFFTHGGAQCLRCHELSGSGGNAGPPLDGIGKRRDEAYLLEALIHPGAHIAPGYGNAKVKSKDGTTIEGLLKDETADQVVIETDGKSVNIARGEITELGYGASAMPDMTTILTPRQVRDVVAFLGDLKPGKSVKADQVKAPPPGELDSRESEKAAPSVAVADLDLGKQVYDNVCAACHGPEGNGVEGAFPPLRGSEWVGHTASALIRMQLHGLEGPITVNGVEYNTAMPPHGETLSDEDIAAVLNHMRRQWGSPGLSEIAASDVAKERELNPDRMAAWTVAELGNPPAPGGPAAAPGSSAAPTAKVAAGVSAPSSQTTVPAQPWPLLFLLSLPFLGFVAGVLGLRGR